mmetsp:Transcript_75458/g.87707  ORF Transcript_75458/g.87707 Transcript_75458/m.87707 type:complete len:223 (-) Transcript_75458:491-1159(-)
MKFVHGREIFLLLDISHHFVVKLHDLFMPSIHGISCSQYWKKLVQVKLVVENRSLLTIFILELLSERSVSSSDGCRQAEIVMSTFDKFQSNEHHSSVTNLIIALSCEFSVFVNLCVSHQHILSWDSDIIKSQIAIIFSFIAKFGSNVSNYNSFHRHVGFQISDLNNKGLETIMLAVDVELSMSNSMVSSYTQLSRPPFCGSDSRRVKNELISSWVESGCCLQ